jgi:hypothetical protein
MKIRGTQIMKIKFIEDLKRIKGLAESEGYQYPTAIRTVLQRDVTLAETDKIISLVKSYCGDVE